MAASLNVFQVAIRQQLDSKNLFNVFHYAQQFTDTVPATLAHLVGLCDAVQNQQIAQIAPLQVDALTYIEAKGFELGPLVGFPLTGPPFNDYRAVPVNGTSVAAPGGTTGGVAGDYLPTFNAVKTAKRSLLPGKLFRGSTHWPGIPEASTAGDRLTATPLAAWTAAANLILLNPVVVTVGAVTCNFFPIVYSPTRARRSATVGANPTDFAVSVNNTVTNALIGTMKHRKVRS
jgi:hypothetical protein